MVVGFLLLEFWCMNQKRFKADFKTLGAVNVFDQRMVIEPREALKLIKKYFPDLK